MAAYAPADNDAAEETYEEDSAFEERVIQVRRVTKVVKGGKQLSFRAVVSFNFLRHWLVACNQLPHATQCAINTTHECPTFSFYRL